MVRDLFQQAAVTGAALLLALAVPLAAQGPSPSSKDVPSDDATDVPAGYVIGAEDVLTVVFWREKELSAEVVVRPDGKISLPLLNDVQALGYTPEQLAEVVEKAAAKYVEDPDATVIVKEIRSRKVYMLGEVARPGTVTLTTNMTVLQLLASAGGLLEHADRKNIVIVRREKGQEKRHRFNYNDVLNGKSPEQNIMLAPGDMVIVR